MPGYSILASCIHVHVQCTSASTTRGRRGEVEKGGAAPMILTSICIQVFSDHREELNEPDTMKIDVNICTKLYSFGGVALALLSSLLSGIWSDEEGEPQEDLDLESESDTWLWGHIYVHTRSLISQYPESSLDSRNAQRNDKSEIRRE